MLDLYLKQNYTSEFNQLNLMCSSSELSGSMEEEVSSKRPRQMRERRRRRWGEKVELNDFLKYKYIYIYIYKGINDF